MYEKNKTQKKKNEKKCLLGDVHTCQQRKQTEETLRINKSCKNEKKIIKKIVGVNRH